MSRSPKRRPLPEATPELLIDDLSHDGRGVARLDGKTCFVDNALPSERVRAQYVKVHAQYDELSSLEILQASPERREPFCPHFGICGGCLLQHLDHAAQIRYKQAHLRAELHKQHLEIPDEKFYPALQDQPQHYRRRARLGAKYVAAKGDRVLVGFRERATPYICDMQSCAVLSSELSALIPELAALIRASSVYRAIPQIEVAHAENLIALNLRILQDLSQEDSERFRAFAEQHQLRLLLQPGKENSIYTLSEPHSEELYYELPEQRLRLYFSVNDFTQINFAINRRMLSQALDWLRPAPADRVLDLFCGLGNFSLALAQRAEAVLGIEGSAAMVKRAASNAAYNHIANAHFAQADLSQTGALHNLTAKQSFNKILIDPPRSGAREILSEIAALRPENILYISCHPATLARDLALLSQNHPYQIERIAVMDMFPHTAHVETICLMSRVEEK